MMLPSAQIMATGAQGDSAHLLAMRGQQAGNTAAALGVPTQTQAVAGVTNQMLEGIQGALTQQHALQTQALASVPTQPGPDPVQFGARFRAQMMREGIGGLNPAAPELLSRMMLG